jgi:3-deoxy-D-manno-octulosonic acid kinase
MAETLASEKLRSLEIPTPRVVAAAVYPRGPFYRGDIATEFIPGGVDLGELVFGAGRSDSAGPQRVAALREAMALIERLAEAGMAHPDLNVKNFLLDVGTSPPTLYILDLDRCRSVVGSRDALRTAMARRLRSSLSKWERISEKKLSREEWETIDYISTS